MRLALAILLFCVFAARSATNVQHIQRFTGGTNGEFLASSVLDAGELGENGTWDLQSGFTNKFQFWKVGTNYPYQLPYWFTIGGTNYDRVPTNWVYYDLKAYDVANEWEQFRFQAPGGGAVGTRSNFWIQQFFFMDGVASASAFAPNLDPYILNGIGGGFGAMQLSVRTNGQHELMAHGQITNGWKFAVRTNVLYLVSALRRGLNGTVEVRVFNPTNNFQPLTNEVGATVSYGDIGGNDTNAYEVRIGANYLNNVGGAGTATGRIWMSAPIIGYGNNAYPPDPSTNLFHADRYFTLTAGMRVARPNRTLETNVSTYADYTPTNIGPALSNALFFAASNTVVVLDGTNYLRNFMQGAKQGVTLRGTNNATIVYLDDGDISFGPTSLSLGQAKFLYPTSVAKGSTNATLATNYSSSPVTGFIAPGEVYMISQKSDFNPDNPNDTILERDTSTGSRTIYQLVTILTTNGNSITFSPPAYQDYTNQPAFTQRYTAQTKLFGLENITITLTNAGNYTTNGADELFDLKGLVDSWVTNCTARWGNNYGIKLTGLLFCDIHRNTVHDSFNSGSGTSHGGYLTENIFACNFYDNLAYRFSPEYHFGGTDQGNIFFANHVAESDGRGWIDHQGIKNNLVEANTYSGTNAFFEFDSYFKAGLFGTFFRNAFSSFIAKRYSAFHNVVGNVLGNTNYSLRYDLNSPGNQYEVFELGFPNISNHNTNGIAPPTGRFFPGVTVGSSTSNYYVFTNVSLQIVDGTNIQGNFSTWPATSAGFGVIFQDGVNTNRYWRLADFQTNVYDQFTLSLGYISRSATEMVLSTPITISNGGTMMLIGPTTTQQRQTEDVLSHIRSFNLVVTNFTEVVVHDPTFLPKGFPISLAHPSGAPSWWVDADGEPMEWPAVDPNRATKVTGNPAGSRYAAMQSEGGGSEPAGDAVTGTQPPPINPAIRLFR